MRGFDPEGSDYDYARAKAGGMKPTANAQGQMKWGSTVRPSESQMRRYNLPPGTYIILKGRKHESWDATVASEEKRGSKIVKHGARYYSVPKKKPPVPTPMRENK